MELKRTFEVIGCLADGIDPKTGAALPAESVFNQPDVIRALNTAFNMLGVKLRGKQAKEKKLKNRPKMQGQKWLPQEDDQLREEIKAGYGIEHIAKAHMRSNLSIEKRLEKLELEATEKE